MLMMLMVSHHCRGLSRMTVLVCSCWQNQFKSQGIKLIPDNPAQQALVYQRMMEGLVLTDKLSTASRLHAQDVQPQQPLQ